MKCPAEAHEMSAALLNGIRLENRMYMHLVMHGRDIQELRFVTFLKKSSNLFLCDYFANLFLYLFR